MTESTPLTRSYVDMPWGQVHVTTSGEGPALLLLHSAPRSGVEFHEVLGQIPDRRCLAPDLPGLGASDPWPEMPTVESYASAIWAVCDRLGVAKASIVGHHGGGVIGLEMAASQPERVDGLVLSSTPWLGPAERAARATNGIYYGFEAKDDLSHIAAMAERRRPWMPPSQPRLWNRLIVDVLRASDDPETPLRALAAYQMERSVGLVTCPTLLLARKGDIWFEQRHEFEKRLAISETEVIDGMILIEDRPDLLVTAVQGFLERVQHP